LKLSQLTPSSHLSINMVSSQAYASIAAASVLTWTHLEG